MGYAMKRRNPMNGAAINSHAHLSSLLAIGESCVFTTFFVLLIKPPAY
jgi:hypothetical protein